MNLNFCKGCGNKLHVDAETCVKCGVRQQAATPKKSQGVAFVLAFLFGFWTWLYTYKDDAWKFWLGMAISIVGIFFLFVPNVFVWFWAMFDQALKSEEYWN